MLKSVSQLMEATDAPQSTISRNLRKRRVRDIVASRKDGTNTYYHHLGNVTINRTHLVQAGIDPLIHIFPYFPIGLVILMILFLFAESSDLGANACLDRLGA